MAKLINLYHSSLKRIFYTFLLLLCNLYVISQDLNNQIKTVVIDPGHGGKDPGTMGTMRYKTYEKDIALDISLKLGHYIEENFPDVKVIYTRKKDVFLELWERTELANKVNADLFISIHCDGFKNPIASGASVFVMGMSKLKANMDVAIRENSVMYLEDNFEEKYEGFDPKSAESYIIFSLMQNTYLDQSISFAQEVDIQFTERANRKSRGVKQAPFYVISRTNMPSVLIEAGFLTNPDEEDYLNTNLGKDYIASAIFRAFSKYKMEIEGIDAELDDSLNTSKPVRSVSNDDVIYKIQLGIFPKSMKDDQLFKNLNIEELVLNGEYKYFTFSTNNKIEADKEKVKHRKERFPDAFIVAFYKGKQINVKEALDLQKELSK